MEYYLFPKKKYGGKTSTNILDLPFTFPDGHIEMYKIFNVKEIVTKSKIIVVQEQQSINGCDLPQSVQNLAAATELLN